jgi:hypothetical protein
VFVGSILTISTLAIGMVIFGAVACSTSDLSSGLGSPVPTSPEALLAELREDKERIDSITDQMSERVKVFNDSRGGSGEPLRLSDVFFEDLTGSERDVLNTMIASEEDVSYKALLQSLANDRETIRGLQDRVLRMEQNLPDQFVVAGKGDSQYKLATEYLTGQIGLDQPRAEDVLARIDMSDELIPGNKVWFFYDAGRDTFRTYVTQGEAGQMPIAMRRAMKRKLISERDAAIANADALEQTRSLMEQQVASLGDDVRDLEARRATLESRVSDLSFQQARLEGNVSDLTAALSRQQNSLFYHAANESELKDQGVITSVLKRFHDVQGVSYDRAIDLTKKSSFRIDAGEVGLEKIDRVRLLPSVFQIERDYIIERSEDGSEATVTILDPEIFRGKEVILSVKG